MKYTNAERLNDNSAELIARLLTDPVVPYWVSSTLTIALTKDPLDAAKWAETLAMILGKRADEMFRGAK